MATIRKRGPYQWQAIIRKRGFPNQVKTFTSKADAQAWAGQLESEMVRGVYVSIGEAERTTLAEGLERYWIEVASSKRHPNQERQRIERWTSPAIRFAVIFGQTRSNQHTQQGIRLVLLMSLLTGSPLG